MQPLDLEECAGCFPATGDHRFTAPFGILFASKYMDHGEGYGAALEVRLTALVDGRVVRFFDTHEAGIGGDDTEEHGSGSYTREVHYVLDSLTLDDGKDEDDEREVRGNGAEGFRVLCALYHEPYTCALCLEPVVETASETEAPCELRDDASASWSACAQVDLSHEWKDGVWSCAQCKNVLHGACAQKLLQFQAVAHDRPLWLSFADEDPLEEDEDTPFLYLDSFRCRYTPNTRATGDLSR